MFDPFKIPEVAEYLNSLKGVKVEIEFNTNSGYHVFRMSSTHCNITRVMNYDARYCRHDEETRAVMYTLRQLALELGNDMVRLPRINNYSDYNRSYEYTAPVDLETLKQKSLEKQEPIINDNAGIF